ncbi:MAG: 16S rRNA (guanine(966)-N(2))-methyltransferase RsmD [Simkaniaceae bacterium]
MGLRIIGGSHRGRIIKSLPGKTTRPTQEKVREALFNFLQTSLFDANFLDLFGGTGAIGFEALSRGAKKATFIEKNKAAYLTLLENSKKLNFSDKTHILFGSVDRHLPKLKGPFDIVYIDPPYDTPFLHYQKWLKLLAEKALSKEALLIIEEDQDRTEHFKLKLHPFLFYQETKNYGRTQLHILKFSKINESNPI